MRRVLASGALMAAGVVLAAPAQAAGPVLSGTTAGGGSWMLEIQRHGGGAFCMRVATFGHVTVAGNGIQTRDGTPVVAAEAGVVTARATRVVPTFSHRKRLRFATRRAPKGFRTTGGENVWRFGGDALAIPPGTKIRRIAGYDEQGRRVALNRAPIASPDPTH